MSNSDDSASKSSKECKKAASQICCKFEVKFLFTACNFVIILHH
jgi:hypothetical protein